MSILTWILVRGLSNFVMHDIWPNITIDEAKGTLLRSLAWELGNEVDHTKFDAPFVPNVSPCSPSNMIVIENVSDLRKWEDLATKKWHDKSMWDAMTPPDMSVLRLVSDNE